jgi:hypothetical protein
MPHAVQIRQTGGPEALNWASTTSIETDRFALGDAADAQKPLEARATSGSTMLTI